MKIKKLAILTQLVLFLTLCLSFVKLPIKAASAVGLGDVSFQEKRNIYDGVDVEYSIGYNNNEDQKAYTIEMKKNALIPYATYGTYVYGGEKLTSMINKIEADTGKKVVAAINGGYYDTSNGIPQGAMIIDGRVVTLGTSAGGEAMVGFKEDGSVVVGSLSASLNFTHGSNNVKVKYLNNDRKFNTTDLYLYTHDYGATTKSTSPGIEVVLEVSEDVFFLDKEVSAKVVSVTSMNASIASNQIVIASGKADDSRLTGLTVGTEIKVKLSDNNPSVGFKDVVQSIGYGNLLAVNGEPTSTTLNDAAVHPRSALGIKDDGTVVIFQVDGRQPGWSNGLSFKQMVDWLVGVKGCKTVLNLDGGGSSTIVARLPGNADGTILNVPSDGIERSNANAILFFAPDEATEKLEYIHAYPKKLIILEGAQTTINVKGTDRYYYPVALDSDATFTLSEGLGTMNGNKFTASTGAKTGTITAKYGNATTEVEVTIVDSVSKITADKTIISISPLESITIGLTVYYNGMPIVCSNEAFTWRLSSSTIGEVKDGVFTGSETGGTGSITVQYKSFEITIPVEVGKLPVMISTFEDTIMGSNWTSVIENPGNGGKGSVSVNTDERYVMFGKKSLRIDYDFRNAVGTTSVTAYSSSGYIKLDGYPTHIGMWVYGDGNGANVRMQMRDGNNAVQYISFVPDFATWEGWKYIEATIPSGLKTPIQLQYPIRVMSVGGNVKTNGTLYFDNIRAVYGFRNDDVIAPVVSDITPSEGTTVASKQPQISFTVKDGGSLADTITGIKKESIEFYLNEEKMDNVIVQDLGDGSLKVNYTPSALSLLRSGPQVVKIRVEDNYGNITIKQWQFFVEGSYIGVDANLPKNTTIYAGDSFSYYVTANEYEKFSKLTGTLNFNSKAIQILSITTVDKNLKLTTDSVGTVNTSGKLAFTLTGMNNNDKPEDGQMFRIIFQTKEGFTGGSNTEITFTDVLVYNADYSTPMRFLLPSYEVSVDYRYRISYITSTVGAPITFKVTDEELNPVSGVTFTIDGISLSLIGSTDEFGYVTFNEFASLAVNTKFTIQAKKNTYYSERTTITMMPSLLTSTPQNIVVSPSVDASTGVYITWQTNLDTVNTVIQYSEVDQSSYETTTISSYNKQVYVKNSSNAIQEYLSHIVEIGNLKPDTVYNYRVGDGTTMSEIYSFKTAPTADIEMLFLGDPQNSNAAGYNLTKNVLAKGLEMQPETDLILYAGDIVDDVQLNSQWQAFHEVIGPFNRSYITSAATGNHDVITGYADPFIYSLTPMKNGVDTIGSSYYYEAGDALVIVIDTESPSKYQAQADWMKRVSFNSSKKFRIVLLHRGPYAANYNEPHVRDFWPAQFEDAKIDLVLSGHDHVYSSTAMKNGAKDVNGVVYVVGGSSGAKFYSASNLDARYWLDYYYDDDYNIYSTIKIKDGVLTLTAYALVSGNPVQIDQRVINSKSYSAKDIVFDEISSIVSSLKPAEINLSVIGESDEVIANSAFLTLKENVNGVSLLNNKIIITSELKQPTEITVVASYFNVTKEIKVKVVYMSATDALDIEFSKYLESLNKIFNND